MRYSPIYGESSINRKYLGKHWTKKQLRGIQNILSATHGVVGPRKQFFLKAFGNNIEEFKEILLLPENYIIYRNLSIENGSRDKLSKLFNSLSEDEKILALEEISTNDFKNIDIKISNPKIKEILNIYKQR